MGECADADDVHARQRVVAQRLVTHPAGDFDDGGAGDDRDGAADEGRRHVIEQNHLGAGAHGLLHLGERGGLDFDLRAVRGRGAAELHGLRERAGGGDMVVFDEDVLAQRRTVVDAAAAAHGVFFERAPAGRRLARVDDPGARAVHGRGIFPREGRHAGEALDEV